jgi:hypothetical protein
MMVLSHHHHRSVRVVGNAIRTAQRGWKWNAAEVSTRLVLIDTAHDLALHYVMFYYLTLSSSRLLSTDESLHEWLLDTLSDPQNETDYLNFCSLSDNRNRSNSFDAMICNGCFDAIMLSDSSSSFDSAMMWDAGTSHHSEEGFEDFGMHKP